MKKVTREKIVRNLDYGCASLVILFMVMLSGTLFLSGMQFAKVHEAPSRKTFTNPLQVDEQPLNSSMVSVGVISGGYDPYDPGMSISDPVDVYVPPGGIGYQDYTITDPNGETCQIIITLPEGDSGGIPSMSLTIDVESTYSHGDTIALSISISEGGTGTATSVSLDISTNSSIINDTSSYIGQFWPGKTYSTIIYLPISPDAETSDVEVIVTLGWNYGMICLWNTEIEELVIHVDGIDSNPFAGAVIDNSLISEAEWNNFMEWITSLEGYVVNPEYDLKDAIKVAKVLANSGGNAAWGMIMKSSKGNQGNLLLLPDTE